MALITAADPDHVVEPVDLTAVDVSKVHPSLTREDCMRSMHAVSDTGRITAGFDAVRSVASRLPLFWPLAVIGYLPGVAWAGRRVYNWVAATRPRDVACTDQVCGIHSLSAAHRASRREGALQNIITRSRSRQTPRRYLAHEPDTRFFEPAIASL